MLNKINEYALPQAVIKIVETVCNGDYSQRKSKPRPPHLLIPMNRGDGRSSVINTLTEYYETFDAIKFSSRDHYLELTLTGTVENVKYTHIEIQENIEYANHFQGVIAFNIDSLLQKLSDVAAEKFFEVVDKVKRHATLVIFVPADCSQKNLDLIASKVGASLIQIPPVKYTANDYAQVFIDQLSLPTMLLSRNSGKKQAVANYITQELPNPTMRKVIELSESMVFNEFAYKKLFGISTSEIERGDLK